MVVPTLHIVSPLTFSSAAEPPLAAPGLAAEAGALWAAGQEGLAVPVRGQGGRNASGRCLGGSVNSGWIDVGGLPALAV